MKYAGDLASYIWKALGYVLRLIRTDITQNIISLDTEKLARRSFQHGGPGPPTGKTGESPGPSPCSDVYEFLKTPHRLVRGQYRGIVWVKEEGSWRNLEICMSPKVGGGQRPPSAPPPWRVGGQAPPCPPVPTPMFKGYQRRKSFIWAGHTCSMLHWEALEILLACRSFITLP